MQKIRIEGHFLEKPVRGYVLPRLGRGWEIHYGDDTKDFHHFHNLFELGYCYRGDGHLVISDREYRYSGNCFTAIPARIPHNKESAPGKKCKWEFLFVDMQSFVENEMQDFGLKAEETLEVINRQGLFYSLNRNQRIGRLLQEVMEEYRRQEPYYEESVKGYLRSLVVELIRTGTGPEIQETGVQTAVLIEKALLYIKDHYREELRMQDLAAWVGLSEPHFRRLFEKTTQMRPLEYINKLRIRQACDLLLKEDISMAEVGYRVGFQTAYSFNRNFREVTGSTPLQWKICMTQK